MDCRQDGELGLETVVLRARLTEITQGKLEPLPSGDESVEQAHDLLACLVHRNADGTLSRTLSGVSSMEEPRPYKPQETVRFRHAVPKCTPRGAPAGTLLRPASR